MPNLTAKLARHVVSYRSAELDSAALTVAKQCILDWHGVPIPGQPGQLDAGPGPRLDYSWSAKGNRPCVPSSQALPQPGKVNLYRAGVFHRCGAGIGQSRVAPGAAAIRR